MAVNEIFELNSMFIGDDRERNELEQRSRTLRTAIDQQEGRFLSEIDKMDEFRKDVKDFDDSVRELEEAIDEVYVSTEIIDPNNDQYIRQMRDCMQTRASLQRDIKSVEAYLDQAILRLQSYTRLGPASILSESIAMSGEEFMTHQGLVALSREYQNAAHQRLAEQRAKLQELTQSIAIVTASKESILSSILAIQDEINGLEAKSEALRVAMKDMQVESEANAKMLQQQSNTLVTGHEQAEAIKQGVIEQLRSAEEQKTEATHQLQSHERDRQELGKENLAITEQHHTLAFKHNKQVETNNTLRATLRVLKEENLLLKSQEAAIRQHSFTEKLELLSFETEELLSNVQETQSRTAFYRRQLAGEDESSPIHALLQQVAESQQRRQETIEKKQRLQHEFESLLAQQVGSREAEEDHVRRARHELNTGHATLHEVEARARGLAQQLEDAPSMTEMLTTIIEEVKSLTNIQAVIEDQVKVLALKELDFQHALQRLRGVQDEVDVQRESQRVSSREQEKRLRLKRLQEQRLIAYKKTIHEHETELKNENDRFQSSLLHQEELLQKRRDTLITQLENVTKITKQQKTDSSSPVRPLQQRTSAPPTMMTGRGQSSAGTGPAAVDKKRKRNETAGATDTNEELTEAGASKRPGLSREPPNTAMRAASELPSSRHDSQPVMRADEQAANMTASEAFDFFVRPSLAAQQHNQAPHANRDNRYTVAAAGYQRPPVASFSSQQRNPKRALEGSENLDNQTMMPTTAPSSSSAARLMASSMSGVTPMAERGVKPAIGSGGSANKNKAKMRAAGPKFGT